MKNFTNNFKQFTSRLSARWLIMALMMLAGTSSAWAKYVYLHATGSDPWTKDGANFAVWYWGGGVTNQWSAIATSLGDGYYSVEINDAATDYKWVRVNSSASNWQANKTNWSDNSGLVWNEGGNATYSNGNLYRMNDFNGDNAYKATFSYVFSYGLENSSWSDKNFPATITLSTNTYEFKVKETLTYNKNNTNNTHTTWLSNSGTMDRNNHEGWTMYADVSQNCKITADVSGTYTFTFDETTKKLSVEYPSACSTPELSDFTYTLPDDDNTKAGNEVMWNGNTHAATVKWKDEDSTEGITIYYKNGDVYSEEAPSAVGEYEVYITTTENNDFCALTTKTKVGTFTITCPAPAEVPKFEVTQHEVVCGNTNIQKGIIKITNPVANYKYRLGNEGNTEYTLDANNSIPGIDGGAKYRISAVRYCGTAKSSTTNEEEYAEISKTDVKLTPTLTSTPIVKCGEGDNAYTPGTLVITNYNADYNYAITPSVGTPTIDGTNATYSINSQKATEYTVTATHNTYNTCSTPASITVALTDNTPTLKEISISSNVQIVCAGDNNVTLTCNLVNPVGTPSYKWFKNDVEIVGETSNLIPAGTLNENTTFSVAVILDNNGCTKEFNAEKLIEVKVRPEAPKFNPNYMTVCQGKAFTLPGSENEGYIWSDALGKPTTANKPNGIDATTDYYAVISFGCPSDATLYTVNVNPLPTISITGNPSAVFYEDVVLTANATDGATVKWYEGGVEKATGATYVVTSETATSKAVTAKAFLNGCESTAASHTVKFSQETCNNVADMTKIYFDTKGNSNFNDNVYLSVAGNNYNKNRSADCNDTGHAGDYWPGDDGTFHKMTKIAGTNIYYVNKPASIPSGKISIWNKNQQGNNNVWQAHVILAKSIDNNNNCLVLGSSTYHKDRESNVYCSTWTTYKDAPAITAPVVKTVSVTSDEDGNVTMEGQVVKTGCDTQAILGLQYKKQKPDGTYEADYTTYPNPGTKEAIQPGKTFTVTTKLEDGTYKVRARIDNSHATNGYGEDIIVVVNTTKTPISDVTLDYCNEDGEDIDDPNPMCKGAIAYVKLSYVGSKYSDIKWLVEGVETNLVTDEGNDVWSYEIQGDGSLSVELKNDANTDPAWPYSNKLPFEIIPEPTAPYISIDPASGVICQGSSATITVENPSKDCSYKLVEEGSKAGFTPYESGDLIYKVQIEGKYYVVAQHNACTDNEYTSNQVAINQVISTNANISIDPAKAVTTPWEPVTITVKPDAGYTYELTYTDGNLAAVDGVRIKQNGDSYTYYIPRPDSWGTGDSDPVRDPINYGIKAQLKVDGEASECKLKDATATIQLKDEDNENCPK